ncbi:uncharacterized protein LOC131666744 [Phymastichus coffea]|uniref:uncharacterized protein LOC131666744 n=1 Tax=Phymastichus coffea TaxID=108790 RepID=UPI00273A828D|nr:uncharacterized protein LOC131666744 [Phymastichus coffea]
MFACVLFMSLYLLATPGVAYEWLTAPEKLSNSIARLFYTERSDESQRIINVKVEIVKYTEQFPNKQCLFDIVSRSNVAAMKIESFRRLTDNLIVLSWYDEMEYNRSRQTRIEVLNMEDCVRIDLNLEVENAIIVPSTDSLNIFFRDSKNLCLSKDNSDRYFYRCWYSYSSDDVINTRIPKIKMEFKVNFDWSSIHIERLPSRNFVVRGLQGQFYHVAKMSYYSGKLHYLMSIPSADRKLQMVSSGLTFCWFHSSNNDRRMYCDQFNNRNVMVYSTEALFSEPMIIKYVQSDYEGQISSLVTKVDCINIKDCWTFTRKNFYHEDNRSTQDTAVINCKSPNRNNWVFFGFMEETTEVSNAVICTRSGDVLGTESDIWSDNDIS